MRLEHHLLAVHSQTGAVVIQVPLAWYSTFDADTGQPQQPTQQAARIAVIGDRACYDGAHDSAYQAALLRLFAEGSRLVTEDTTITGHELGWVHHDPAAPAQVLRGEQSNTSIIVSSQPVPLMVKLFRVITDGANPDVEVTRALTVAGVQAVPRVAGWLDGSWAAPDGSSAHGHLAVSAQFMAGSRDAWREALDAVEGGDPFVTEAESLGSTTALVHQRLAEALGALPCDRAHLDELIDALAGRVSWARRQVLALDDLGPALDAHVAALARITPDQVGDLQRIHGDYHLGQVLHSPEKGWVLLDFEGEPLRPLAERAKPDCTLRDVVGMLRSFDYAAAFAVRKGTCAAEAGAVWAADCRAAFLRGYGRALPERADSLGGALFDALWLDKALYEVVYEARNRPDWVSIPMEAVHRVLH